MRYSNIGTVYCTQNILEKEYFKIRCKKHLQIFYSYFYFLIYTLYIFSKLSVVLNIYFLL